MLYIRYIGLYTAKHTDISVKFRVVNIVLKIDFLLFKFEWSKQQFFWCDFIETFKRKSLQFCPKLSSPFSSSICKSPYYSTVEYQQSLDIKVHKTVSLFYKARTNLALCANSCREVLMAMTASSTSLVFSWPMSKAILPNVTDWHSNDFLPSRRLRRRIDAWSRRTSFSSRSIYQCKRRSKPSLKAIQSLFLVLW